MKLSVAIVSIAFMSCVAVSASDAGATSAKEETWTDAMLAVRAAAVAARAAAGGEGVPKGIKPFDSGPIRGDGEGKQVSAKVSGCNVLRLSSRLESGGGNCHIWGEARLIALDGTVTRLCDLRPVSMSVGWGQLLTNKNWQNHPLRIGKKEFEHGIWVHSNSDVIYAIGGKYERFEAWAGMDADRATGVARFSVSFESGDVTAGLWQKVARRYPEQMEWLTRDVGRARQTDPRMRLVTDNDGTKRVEGLVRKVVGQLGANGAGLREQLDALKKGKGGPDDRRWLDLYARCCRLRDCHDVMSRVGMSAARDALGEWLLELAAAGVSPDDSRWKERLAALKEIAESVPGGRDVDLASVRASVEALSKACPNRFKNSADILAAIDVVDRRLKAVVPGLKRGESAAMEQVAPLLADVRKAQRNLLLGFDGMREFLAVPANSALEAEWESQFAVLARDLRNTGHFERVAGETYRPESLPQESDRDPLDMVVRRTSALIADLKRNWPSLDGVDAARQLDELRVAARAVDVDAAEARYALFADACRLRRQIAFSNPLLDIDELLFLKRHLSTFNHMCDQYYGEFAVPGGGLSVLSHPFGPEPKTRSVLTESVVQKGRLRGSELESGSFLSPDLSYDAKQVAFAYVECQGEKGHDHHTDHSRGHWKQGRSYHVFKANIDGTGLEQLTDGTWNDFDPCWMPSGRLAFISERRGGYLRCGRVCPTYTLYDMAADGSDIRCLSVHETNEWHPSVMHDGRIIWTRWDYVDRHGCVAHMPWITTPDGCDPRPLHGNYSPRRARPDMELDVMAIPGSPKYIATAAPHHGQAFGSLILIDPRVEDDDGMGPVKRITPEVGFPESQGGQWVYGSAWPLSEDYYLCVYDADMDLRGRGGRRNYGIYLVDSFGNKELIYRDPEIACHNPIPLRPRPRPPVIRGSFEPVMDDAPAEATVGVVDVYNSSQSWPEGTRIKSLRVYQILPLSIASVATRHNTGIQVPQGNDSINLARAVLGTVPVEKDGSAHFAVPAGKELYFQALDENGLAVTSMRSATHFQPGENALCQGCHEPRHGAPPAPTRFALAMQRPPSRLTPDVDGTNPFSYPRLVQPVLEKHCVACHAKNPDKAPPLTTELAKYPLKGRHMDKPTAYYASYVSLAPKYGFYDYGGKGWDDPKWYRTTPGEFGARASKLYQMLMKGHHGVKLPPEDLHRLTVWLDSTSVFYGVYEEEGGLAQLRGEIAKPTLE